MYLDLSIMSKYKLTSANWCKFDSKQRQIVITHEINGINPLNRVQFVKDSIETIQFGLKHFTANNNFIMLRYNEKE